MPSTLVHLAIAGLLAAALLEDAFDVRSLAVVLFVTIVPDLDTFVGIVLPGTHRAAFHNVFLPVVAAAAIAYDLRREDSWLRSRDGRVVRIAWVSLLAYVFAGIGPDLFLNGVNVFYPIHDQFYALNGKVFISNQEGFVQTLWETREETKGTGRAPSTRGTTETKHYATAVDPVRGKEPKAVERIVPIADSGIHVLLMLSSTVVVGTKLWLRR